MEPNCIASSLCIGLNRRKRVSGIQQVSDEKINVEVEGKCKFKYTNSKNKVLNLIG